MNSLRTLLSLVLVVLYWNGASAFINRGSHHSSHDQPPLVCHDGQWMFNATHIRECRPCTICPEGTGVHKPCGQHHDVTCRICSGNWFSLMINGQRKCVPCTVCHNRHLEQECTLFQDAVCGNCLEGHFYDAFYDTCRPCSRCPEGYSEFEIPECSDQPEGFRCQPMRDISDIPDDAHSSVVVQGPGAVEVKEPQITVFGKWTYVFVGLTSAGLVFCVIFSVLNFYQTMRLRKHMRRGYNPPIYQPLRRSTRSMTSSRETQNMFDDSGVLE